MAAWLPYIDHAKEKNNVHDYQGIVALAYIGTLIVLCLLSLAIHNIVNFLIGQSRWRVAPLLWFYVLTCIFLLMRIYTLIFILDNKAAVHLYLPSVMKLLLGYTQIWTTIELNIRVNQCRHALKLLSSSHDAANQGVNPPTPVFSNSKQRIELQTRNDKSERTIRVLRCVSSLLITVSLICFTIYLSMLTNKELKVVDDYEEFNDKMYDTVKIMSQVCAILSIAMVVAFFIFSSRLYCSIRKKEHLMKIQTDQAGAYSSERSGLLIVGSIFVISYMVDSLFNFILIEKYAYYHCLSWN